MPAIVDSGAAYIAAQTGAGQPVKITDFVLAYIDGLDHTQPVDLAETLPDAGDTVYQAPASQSGYLSPDKVVYSLAMDTSVGDFTFNWLGLLASDGTLVAVAYLPDTIKTANSGGIQGNNITRNFLLQFADAQLATGISVPAETWQIDQTAYLNAMDERERLSNADIYGAGAFFEGGWELINNAGSFELQPGIGYVGGVRIVCTAPIVVDAGALPTAISLDVALQKGVDQVAAEVTPVRGTPSNYTDGGTEHFVVQVADIDSGGAVTDRRLVFEAPNGLAKYLLDLIKSGTAHNHDDQYLGKTAKAVDADKVDGISAERMIYGYGPAGISNVVGGWSNLEKSGFYQSGPSNDDGPEGAIWDWGINVEYGGQSGSGWHMVSTYAGGANPTWYLRAKNNGDPGDWHEIITNKGGQAINGDLSVKDDLILTQNGSGGVYGTLNNSGATRMLVTSATDHVVLGNVANAAGVAIHSLKVPSWWNGTVSNDLLHTGGGQTINASIGIGTSISGGFSNGKGIALGDPDTGIRQASDGVLELWTNSEAVLKVSKSDCSYRGKALIHTGGGQTSDPFLIRLNGPFDPDMTGPSHLPQGLYAVDLGKTTGASGNPRYTTAIVGSINENRQIALSVDNDGYLYGKYSYANAGPYVWHSKVKQADNAGTLGGQDSDFYRNASNLNAGQISTTLIPNLSAGKITSGILGEGRIPDLDAGKIATGLLTISRGGTGAGTAADARSNLGLGNLATQDSLTAADVGAPPTGRTISAGTGLSGGGSLASNRTISLTNIAAGSSSAGALRYNGKTRSAGRLYGGTTNPSSSNRLNYDGYFNATRLYRRSSRRVKNIERVDSPEESLRRVLAIGKKGVSVGHYKSDKRRSNSRWLIAEDVAEISPEVILYDDEGLPASMDYDNLIGDLYAAVYQLHKIHGDA